jgi:hypothetical protein
MGVRLHACVQREFPCKRGAVSTEHACTRVRRVGGRVNQRKRGRGIRNRRNGKGYAIKQKDMLLSSDQTGRLISHLSSLGRLGGRELGLAVVGLVPPRVPADLRLIYILVWGSGKF